MLIGKNRGKWKRLAAAGSWTQDTSGLSPQCSATEPQQSDNHQPSQSSIHTAQVPQSHTWQPLSMCPISLVCSETVLSTRLVCWTWLTSLSLTWWRLSRYHKYLVMTFPHAAATRQTDEEELSTPMVKLIALTDKQWNAGPLLPT